MWSLSLHHIYRLNNEYIVPHRSSIKYSILWTMCIPKWYIPRCSILWFNKFHHGVHHYIIALNLTYRWYLLLTYKNRDKWAPVRSWQFQIPNTSSWMNISVLYFNPSATRVFSSGPTKQQVITGTDTLRSVSRPRASDNMCYTFYKGIVIYSPVPL